MCTAAGGGAIGASVGAAGGGGGKKGKDDRMDRQDFFAFCLQKPEFRDLALKYINDNETSEDIKNNMSEGKRKKGS